MLTTAHRADRVSRSLATLARHPIKVVVALLPLGIVAMVLIDLALGATAEYFNAAHLIEAWAQVIGGGSVFDAPQFVMNQVNLGAAPSLLLGTALLIVEPGVALAALILPASWIARRRIR